MRELVRAVPDVDVLLAMEPEELGAKLLFLIRSREGAAMFHPGNYSTELRGDHQNPGYNLDDRVLLALNEAWGWLEAQGLTVAEPSTNGQNGWRRLSRRARRYESEAHLESFRASLALPKEILDPRIRERVWLAFVRGEYDVAVFHAMKEAEVVLRAAAGASADLPAVKLARMAFDPRTGSLTDLSSTESEREMRAHFVAGALGCYKNPQSHRHVGLNDPAEAIEQIMIANHLIRLISDRVLKAS